MTTKTTCEWGSNPFSVTMILICCCIWWAINLSSHLFDAVNPAHQFGVLLLRLSKHNKTHH